MASLLAGQFLANLIRRGPLGAFAGGGLQAGGFQPSIGGDPKRPPTTGGFTPAGFSGGANRFPGIGGGGSSQAISAINQQFDIGASDVRQLFDLRLSSVLDDLAGRGLANSSTRGGLQINAASGLARELARLRANQATATTGAISSDRQFQLQILELLRGLSRDTGGGFPGGIGTGPAPARQFG